MLVPYLWYPGTMMCLLWPVEQYTWYVHTYNCATYLFLASLAVLLIASLYNIDSMYTLKPDPEGRPL